METYQIATGDGKVQSFEIAIYPHHLQPNCRYSVFQNGKLTASLSHDDQGIISICQKYEDIDESILDLLCEAIEVRHPQNFQEENPD